MSAPDPAKRDVLISKALSYLLRHGAIKEKIPIDNDGFVKVSDILNHNRMKSNKTTRADIERIVAANDKQRFTLRGDEICANQGHSIKTVLDTNLQLLTKETIPEIVFHGTYFNKLPLIYESGGLNRMTRNHIHFTTTSEKMKNISGIRNSANCLIFLDVEKCLANGFEFYRSANDVILSAGDSEGKIGWEFFLKVVDKKTGEEVDTEKYKRT